MNVKYDELLNEIKELNKECTNYLQNKKINRDLSNNEFKLKMQYKYSNIYENFISIFNQCINNTMDIEMMTFMINKAKEIENNKLSNHNASVKVGEKILEKFIKPQIEKNKKNQDK